MDNNEVQNVRRFTMEDNYNPIYDIDNILVGPAGPEKYRLREAIALREKLGRPLTEEEMKEFIIDDKPEIEDPIAI